VSLAIYETWVGTLFFVLALALGGRGQKEVRSSEVAVDCSQIALKIARQEYIRVFKLCISNCIQKTNNTVGGFYYYFNFFIIISNSLICFTVLKNINHYFEIYKERASTECETN